MSESPKENGRLTMDTLMTRTRLTDKQVNQAIAEIDLSKIADLFDNIDDNIDDLCEQFGLSAAEKTDVERLQHRSTKNSTKKALKLWRDQNPYKATFKNLLIILLDNKKGGVAKDVAHYISNRQEPTNKQPRPKKWTERQVCSFMLVLLTVGIVLLSMALFNKDQDELQILTMADFEQYKANVSSNWYSPPVYTHHQGYKFCLSVFASGIKTGKGTHASVSVHFMRGEFDESLKWPFRGTITIRLIDQLHGEDHRERTLTYDDMTDSKIGVRVTEGDRAGCSWGEPQFIRHSKLKPNYLSDNTLLFQTQTHVFV